MANATSHPPPRALTKAGLVKEAAAREALRKEFLLLQAAVKETPILIPFVFYDGTDIPGGVCKVKKGDFIWVFLDMTRKVGAEVGAGEKGERQARREWARVGVDDLMMVRGELIIPHVCQFPSLNIRAIANKYSTTIFITLYKTRLSVPKTKPYFPIPHNQQPPHHLKPAFLLI